MDEKSKIAQIFNLVSHDNNNYEDAFPLLFELSQSPGFMAKGSSIPASKLEDVKIIFQHIVKVQVEICTIEKWPIPETTPKITTNYLEEYNMWHLSLAYGVMVFIGIVFPGLKRGVIQGLNTKTGKASFSKFLMVNNDSVVN
jgi:hypothetical protein